MLGMHARKFIVYIIPETGGVDNSECDANSIFFKFCNAMYNLVVRYGTTSRELTNVDRLDPDAFLNVSRLSIVRDLVA